MLDASWLVASRKRHPTRWWRRTGRLSVRTQDYANEGLSGGSQPASWRILCTEHAPNEVLDPPKPSLAPKLPSIHTGGHQERYWRPPFLTIGTTARQRFGPLTARGCATYRPRPLMASDDAKLIWVLDYEAMGRRGVSPKRLHRTDCHYPLPQSDWRKAAEKELAALPRCLSCQEREFPAKSR